MLITNNLLEVCITIQLSGMNPMVLLALKCKKNLPLQRTKLNVIGQSYI